MADDMGKQIGNLWDRFRKKASATVMEQSAALVRGKIAAHDVLDDAGVVVVGAGHLIDDAVIERATLAGKVPAVIAAAAAAQTQDLKDRIKSEYERTPEGQDSRNLADSEEYLEARKYIRYVAGVEVTDIRGSMLLPAGKVIDDEDVRRMREAGQLAALIYSAQQSGPPGLSETGAATTPVRIQPAGHRTAVPLAESFDLEEVGPGDVRPEPPEGK